MALTVCCPCGNPIALDNIDVVAAVDCPRCKREINIELDAAGGRTGRGLLTVMEGPFWVGEQFVVPVGAELRIGRAGGNWLSLDADGVSDVHCHLQLPPDGAAVLEDRQSATGTWVGKQRIARGRLSPKQSFIAGPFRLRFDIVSSDGTTVVAAPGVTASLEAPDVLPMMRDVKDTRDPFRWFAVNRYIIARWYMLFFAFLVAANYLLALRARAESQRPWLAAVLSAAVVLTLSILAGQKLALVHRQLKYISLGVLLLLSIVSLAWSMPAAAIGCLFMAACLTVLIMRVPSPWLALVGTTVGLCGLTVLLAADWHFAGRVFALYS